MKEITFDRCISNQHIIKTISLNLGKAYANCTIVGEVLANSHHSASPFIGILVAISLPTFSQGPFSDRRLL